MRTCLVVVTALGVGAVVACGTPNVASYPFDASAGGDGNHHPIIGYEGGAADSGVSAEDTGVESGPSCTPVGVTTFAPVDKQPVGPFMGACSQAQISEAVGKCFDKKTASSSKCNAWVNDTANGACVGCWAGPESNPTWSPILLSPMGVPLFADVATCIALADPAQLDCAKAVEYTIECDVAACLGPCPATDSLALSDCFDTANGVTDAGVGGCSTYATKTLTCKDQLEADGGGHAAFCLHIDPGSATFRSEDLIRFFNLACGGTSSFEGGIPPPPVDAAFWRDGP